MLRYFVLLSLLVIAPSVFAKVLTIDPKKMKVECVAEPGIAYHRLSVSFDPKVKIPPRGDNRYAESGGGIVSSCELAQNIELQVFAAIQKGKEIEFDTESFKTNVVGEPVTDSVTVDPKLVEVDCQVVKQQGIDTAMRRTNVRIGKSLERKVNDFKTFSAALGGAVVPGSECKIAASLQTAIRHAKKTNRTIDLNLKTFVGEPTTSSASNVNSKTQPTAP